MTHPFTKNPAKNQAVELYFGATWNPGNLAASQGLSKGLALYPRGPVLEKGGRDTVRWSPTKTRRPPKRPLDEDRKILGNY